MGFAAGLYGRQRKHSQRLRPKPPSSAGMGSLADSLAPKGPRIYIGPKVPI